MASTPLRAVRIPDEVWGPAQEAAEAAGETLSAVIRRALVRYAKQQGKKR